MILDWYQEQQRKAEEQAAAQARKEARDCWHEEQVRAWREHQERQEKAQAEEWERNAPEREQEQREKEERERLAKIEDCKRYWVQWSNKPKLRDGFIASTLPQDEQSGAEFAEWLACQVETAEATTAE